jgi:hypothetical protein
MLAHIITVHELAIGLFMYIKGKKAQFYYHPVPGIAKILFDSNHFSRQKHIWTTLVYVQVELYKTWHGAVQERRWAIQISLWYEAKMLGIESK